MTPKTLALQQQLLAAKCRNWSLWATLQYAELYGDLQRVPTAEDYMTSVRSRGMFR